MVFSDTALCNRRLLLNAEPFGFGPTAAIADFFPHLRKSFTQLGFVGKGHTLDLQRQLPYDAIHDISAPGADDEGCALKAVFSQYDMFLTALDFEMAEKALRAGLTVCIYDPLAWYWKRIHPVMARCHLGLLQDFYQVKERVAEEPDSFSNVQVVPPILPSAMPWRGKREHVLLNLGGLSNPFWSGDDTLTYARLMTAAFHKMASERGESIVVAGNATLARELREFGVSNFTREQMQHVLHKAKYAFMTPGLGNIYDAARYATPTIWLPPANDSQGQQKDILVAHGVADGALDWHDFALASKIDYCGEQKDVLQAITCAASITSLLGDMKDRLVGLMSDRRKLIAGKVVGACTDLAYSFGWGGCEEVARLVLELALKTG